MANETVGTFLCSDCNTVADVKLTKRGKGTYLYVRCGCGCDQRTGKAIQEKWAHQMTPRAGFEHLKPEQTEPQPLIEPETTEPEPKPVAEQEPVKQVKGAGLMPIFGGLCAVGLLLLTAGKSGGMS